MPTRTVQTLTMKFCNVSDAVWDWTSWRSITAWTRKARLVIWEVNVLPGLGIPSEPNREHLTQPIERAMAATLKLYLDRGRLDRAKANGGIADCETRPLTRRVCCRRRTNDGGAAGCDVSSRGGLGMSLRRAKMSVKAPCQSTSLPRLVRKGQSMDPLIINAAVTA